MRRLFGFFPGIFRELKGAWRHASDARSRIRLAVDIGLYRVLKLWPNLKRHTGTRTIRLDGAAITYRVDRGDIQGIREVWFDEVYRVPAGDPPRTVLDLGANIGLTTVWLATRYGCDRVIAVEPDPDNSALVRRNMEANSINGEVVEAAVGPDDGYAWFARSGQSNLGSLSSQEDDHSIQVKTRTPASLLREHGLAEVDLCKLDIEGGEQELLVDSDTSWLKSVRSLLMEIHPTLVDHRAVIAAIEAGGMTFYPPGTQGRKTPWFVSSK
jgi:FkbM family methyltransferase